MRIIRDIYYGSEKIFEKTLDLCLPDGEPTAIFLYMHGGGLESGHKYDRLDAVSAYLTARGIGYASINYRMYPTARYPEFIQDAAEAVAWTYRYMKTELSCDKLYVGMIDTVYVGTGITFPQYGLIVEFDQFASC